MVFDLIRELSKVLPRVPVWLGGPEVSYDPEATLSALPLAAGVMIGEGEETFRERIELYADALPSAPELSLIHILWRKIRMKRMPEPRRKKRKERLENRRVQPFWQ